MPVAINGEVAAEFRSTPDLELDAVARAKHVIGGGGCATVRNVGLGACKQIPAINREQFSGGFTHEELKLAGHKGPAPPRPLLPARCPDRAGVCGLPILRQIGTRCLGCGRAALGVQIDAASRIAGGCGHGGRSA